MCEVHREHQKIETVGAVSRLQESRSDTFLDVRQGKGKIETHVVVVQLELVEQVHQLNRNNSPVRQRVEMIEDPHLCQCVGKIKTD